METKNKIKVLHTDNSIDYTGGFRALLEYIVHSNQEIESIVVLPRGSRCIPHLENVGVKYYEVPFVEIRKNIWDLLSYFPFLFINAWRIKVIAKKENITILHSNDLYNGSLYLVKYFYRYNKPLITHLRLLPASYPTLLYTILKKIHLKYSNVLIAVSQAVKESYDNSEKVIVIYDIADSAERYAPYKVSFDGKRYYNFLYLANYTMGKGQDMALKAFELLYKKNPNCTLTFAGGTLRNSNNIHFKNSLINQCKGQDFAKNIVFEDFAENVELKMKSYDCILNFSKAESFSYTAFDALRFGVPLIASDSGGPTELMGDGKSGLIVKNGDVPEMASAMQVMSYDVILNNTFSENSKRNMHSLIIKSKRYSYLSDLFALLNLKK